jgi:ATP-binding cassette subfamily B multidrug efflux pump
MLGASKTFAGKSIHYFRAQQKETGSTEGYIEEIMNGEKVVKVFTHEDEVKEEFNKHNEDLFKVSENATFYSNVLGPVLMNISNFVYVIVAIAGSILIFTGCFNISLRGYEASLSVGIVISFLTLTRQFAQSINNISQQIGIIAQASAGASRVFNMIDQKPEEDDGYVTLVNVKIGQNNELIETKERTNIWAWKHPHHEGGITYTLLKGEIVLNHVDFGYVPEKIVLHDVTIDAKAGERIAFVGATGAGKTTITNLINRFYDIQDGKIRYDGININKIKKSDLRKSLGVVLQDTSLFTGTVLENIRYGRLDATDEEVYEAAKIANAYDFITRLPQGFNTMLTSDGANLSQGQRQLLSIARCAVANTPAMILDEATSSIDTRTEQLVQEGTNKLMAGRTVFVIAHRLSTVQNSNNIIVLDHGRIIEEGTHDDLIKKKGVYYQLYTGAFELE